MESAETHSTHHKHSFDKAGIFLSAICLVHCTVLPISLALLQLLGVNLFPDEHSHVFHTTFAFILLGVGGYAFGQGYRRHHRALPLSFGMLGTAMLFIGALNPGEYLTHFQEHAVTIAGTFVLIFAHIKNRNAPICSTHTHH